MSEPPFDPESTLRVLQEHEVAFIVVGIVAALAQGSPIPTRDLDVTPSTAADNYERVASALRDLDARLRLSDGSGVAVPIEARYLAGNTAWTLITRFGVLDLIYEPAGTRGYDDLRQQAIEVDLGTGKPVLVAALLDVIRMKEAEASSRLKDRAQLPALRQTLDVIREQERRA